jgi:hypothetical protein
MMLIAAASRLVDVGRVIFLDHLDAGEAVFGDLVDVGSFHQAQTNLCMPQTVSSSRSAFSIEPEILFLQNRPEKLALPVRKQEIGRLRKTPLLRAVIRGVRFVLSPALLRRARWTEPGLQSRVSLVQRSIAEQSPSLTALNIDPLYEPLQEALRF